MKKQETKQELDLVELTIHLDNLRRLEKKPLHKEYKDKITNEITFWENKIKNENS